MTVSRLTYPAALRNLTPKQQRYLVIGTLTLGAITLLGLYFYCRRSKPIRASTEGGGAAASKDPSQLIINDDVTAVKALIDAGALDVTKPIRSTQFHLFFNPLKPSLTTSAVTFANSKEMLDLLIGSGDPTHSEDDQIIYFPQNTALLEDYIQSLPDEVWIRNDNHTHDQRMILNNCYMHAYRTRNETLLTMIDKHARTYRVALPRPKADAKMMHIYEYSAVLKRGNQDEIDRHKKLAHKHYQVDLDHVDEIQYEDILFLPSHPGMLRQPQSEKEFEEALALMKKYCTCEDTATAMKIHTTRLLFQSLLFGNEDMIQYAINKGVDINEVDPQLGMQPILHAAVHVPHLPMIKRAVTLGAKVTKEEVESAGITDQAVKAFLLSVS